MATAGETTKAIEIKQERGKLKRELTLLPLFALIYFTVCGGSFGAEPMVGYSGPGMAILLFALTPILFSIPNMLMVREMNSMMPVEGGYYHWVKKAFGRFVGFMAGWMNWVVSWVDVSIYPVLAAYYLGYFIKPLREGTTIFGVEVSAEFLSFLLAAVLIWGISYLNIRGAKLAGLTTSWLGVFMLIPLAIMSIFGIIAWIKQGYTPQLPFLPSGQTWIGALSTGIYVAMWNFMGWELPTAAGDEIVNPKKTYPKAMALVLVAAIATYAIPTITGLYGGAGENGRYALWGIEASDETVGVQQDLIDSGITQDQIDTWNTDTSNTVGWEFPDIAHQIGNKIAGVDSSLSYLLGGLVTFAAVLSMIGLFIGNGLGGTRVPFALAEDGMMPKFMTKVHPKYGTPWVAILICAFIYSVFSLSAFAALVVIDVFLNMVVLMAEFGALWVMRFTHPKLERQKVPGGYPGLIAITLAPLAVIILAIVSNVMEDGLKTIGWALIAMAAGAIIYFPMYYLVKPGVPDVDPFHANAEEE